MLKSGIEGMIITVKLSFLGLSLTCLDLLGQKMGAVPYILKTMIELLLLNSKCKSKTPFNYDRIAAS